MEVIKSDSELKCSNKRKFMPMDGFYWLMLMECERRSKHFEDDYFTFSSASCPQERREKVCSLSSLFCVVAVVVLHAKRTHSNSPKIKILFKNRFAHMFKRTLSKKAKRKNGNKMSRFGLKVIDFIKPTKKSKAYLRLLVGLSTIGND